MDGKLRGFLLTGAILTLCSNAAVAAEGVYAKDVDQGPVYLGFTIAIVGSVIALIFAFKFFKWMVAQDEGNETMVRIAQHVRDGADAYLTRQYKVVAVFFAITCVLLAVVAFGFGAQSKWVPFAFLTGGFFSGVAGWFGMKTATLASSRTAQGAMNSLNQGLQVAFRSGAVMGLVVVGLGLLDICLWFGFLNWIWGMELTEITVTMLCFGMGASSQALFARVGGGIFTKAADVGADLVGKVEAGIPEDDVRNPATIADNVGDNVGDVAGMGADLYESYCGSILASAALGVAAYRGWPEMQYNMLLLPMVLAGVGILVSIIGIYLVRTEEGASQRNLLKALARGIDGSSVLVAVAAAGLVYMFLVGPSKVTLPDGMTTLEEATTKYRVGESLFGVFGAIVIGLIAGTIIGKWTEYSTSEEYAPTKRIADQSKGGPATVIIAGIAEGLFSVWVPIVVIGVAILAAFGSCVGLSGFTNPDFFAMGLYGVAVAAVGMLSTLGITLATDAYGPIADNAGGNAQMSELEPIVRERTDALDSLGNTTAATGKGFAIGSAALTALALLAAYVEEVRVGFDHWAEKPAVEEVMNNGGASDDMAHAKVFLLSRTALAYKEQGDQHPSVFLIFPASSKVLNKDQDLLTIKSAPVGSVLVDKDRAPITINLQALLDNDKVVANGDATIPDFVRYYNVTIMNPKVLVGMFMGVMLAFVFCAMTMKAVGRAANAMVEEVRRQFREITGIMEGTAEPEYAACVDISTAAAQKEMMVPALLGICGPIGVGLLLGVEGVMGMLAGGLTSGFAVAIFMANAGGSWDNAKKYVEAGAHGGKGTEAHKATVVGDTVGDPFKDTSGPSLNILIKLMSMVSVVFAGLVVQYTIQNLF
ncbi:MAG: sodium-translocating pyrophosphatase [Planctomycetaceae bacterium]|nr:sodium-translocating pyrophosphatase [Planctomycetaceae bacterium]MBT6483317.1 sodium-translocating pyrophosphatase [Planctomycetaceae bacterium]MBT6497480.1 sodium-translocating pyrophosphatase [Planctomycetaceae bacterium]